MEDKAEVTAKRCACRHVHITGRRCGSPALRGEEFCYFHHTTRRPAVHGPHLFVPFDASFDMPSLEDRPSIHAAITEVSRRLAANQLEYRKARLLLYALQVASHNLPREPRANINRPSQPAEQLVVEELQFDPVHGPLAVIAELPPPKHESEPDLLCTLQVLR